MSEQSPAPETKRDMLDNAKIVMILNDQLAQVPTPEEIERAYGHSDLMDPIGDWITVVHGVAVDAVRRIEAKGAFQELLERVERMVNMYKYGSFDVSVLKDSINAAQKLSEGIIAALESSPGATEEAA